MKGVTLRLEALRLAVAMNEVGEDASCIIDDATKLYAFLVKGDGVGGEVCSDHRPVVGERRTRSTRS
jgi:hypothetical protein